MHTTETRNLWGAFIKVKQLKSCYASKKKSIRKNLMGYSINPLLRVINLSLTNGLL